MKDGNNIESSFTFRVNDTLLEEFQRAAKINHRNASQILREKIENYSNSDAVFKHSEYQDYYNKEEWLLNTKTTIKLSEQQVRDFKKVCLSRNETPSTVVRLFIDSYLNEYR